MRAIVVVGILVVSLDALSQPAGAPPPPVTSPVPGEPLKPPEPAVAITPPAGSAAAPTATPAMATAPPTEIGDTTATTKTSTPITDSVTTTAPAAPASLTFAGITISGSLDAYASINPARSATNAAPNQLYAFETQANGASVSLAKIALERKAAPVGFRLDVGFGQTIDIVNATDTASGMGHDIMRNLEQAYVTWAATSSLTLKIGKLVTHHGMEVIESQSNWNYTHSLLFAYAIPFTQTGIAVDWVATDKLEATLFVVNGLNNTFEGNAFIAMRIRRSSTNTCIATTTITTRTRTIRRSSASTHIRIATITSSTSTSTAATCITRTSTRRSGASYPARSAT